MRERLAWIDALRVFDAALVVLVHGDYLARPDPFTWWPAGIYSILPYGLCVPVFFAIAGYVGARSSASALFGRAVRLLPLLFAHGILLMLIGVRDAPTLAGQVVELVMGVWYLYFVAALVQILALHAVVERFFVRRERMLFGIALGCTVVAYSASSANLWLVGSDFGALELRLRSLGPTWAGFYALGLLAARRPELFESLARRWWQLALVAAVSVVPFLGEIFAEDGRYHHASTMQTLVGGLPYQLAGTLTVLAVFARAERVEKVRHAFRVIGRAGPATLSIYLLHGTFLWLLYQRWIHGKPVVHPLEVPILALLAAGGALIARFVVRPLPAPLPWVLAGVAAKGKE